MFRFSRALQEAARRAAAEGQLTPEDLVTIRRARFRPLVMIALRRQVYEEAILCKAVPDGTLVEAVDWESVLAALREILPLILQFLEALLVIFA